MRFLGVDLAWRDSGPGLANESGVVALDADGRIVEAGWRCGVADTVAWVNDARQRDTVLFVDAPLVVANEQGMRHCEKQVASGYMRWNVAANATNRQSLWLAGVRFRQELELAGWRYDDGTQGPRTRGRRVLECYPYTTLVGVEELGYDVERPRYKRKPRHVPAALWRAERAVTCNCLVQRLSRLRGATPPIDLASHPVTRSLLGDGSPLDNQGYKHREDLIDAVICAWTAAYWVAYGTARCQVLGVGDPLRSTPLATIIAPCRPQQRLDTGASPH